MIVHLIDGTYELYRQHFGQAVRHSSPPPLSATRGVVTSTLQLLVGGATHVTVAVDHVIESFRNQMYEGYKTSDGMEAEILDQIPLIGKCITQRSDHKKRLQVGVQNPETRAVDLGRRTDQQPRGGVPFFPAELELDRRRRQIQPLEIPQRRPRKNREAEAEGNLGLVS